MNESNEKLQLLFCLLFSDITFPLIKVDFVSGGRDKKSVLIKHLLFARDTNATFGKYNQVLVIGILAGISNISHHA